MRYMTKYNSPIGNITLFSDGEYLTNLYLDGQSYKMSEQIIRNDNLEVFDRAKMWLDIYFSGGIPNIYVKIRIVGSDFEKEVINILRCINYGEVITYGEIARKIALSRNIPKMSSQAVGRAVGNNPVSIIIPCHRVIGKDNKLVGYNGGIELKKKLLMIEGIKL